MRNPINIFFAVLLFGSLVLYAGTEVMNGNLTVKNYSSTTTLTVESAGAKAELGLKTASGTSAFYKASAWNALYSDSNIYAPTFVGAVTGTATVATTVTVADTTDTTCSVALTEDATGNLGVKSDGNLKYNAVTGALGAQAYYSATAGNGMYIGDSSSPIYVQGGNIYGNASTVTVDELTMGDSFSGKILCAASGDGNKSVYSGMSYNFVTGVLQTSTFQGDLMGNASSATTAITATTADNTTNVSTRTAAQIVAFYNGDHSGYAITNVGNVDGVDVSAHAADTTTAHGAVSTATANKIALRDAYAGLRADSYYLGTTQALWYYAENPATYKSIIVGNAGATMIDNGSHDSEGNTIVGYDAGIALTEAYSCTLVGGDAGKSINTGWGNSAFGQSALASCTSGLVNCAVGETALRNIGTTGGNTGVGTGAGRYRGTGTDTLTDASTSIFLGYNTRSVAGGGQSNETVIGYNAVGQGSNTAIIGLLSTATGFYAPGSYTDTTGSAANLFVGTNGRISRSTSSARYKTNIVPLSKDTSKVYEIEAKEYKHAGDNRQHIGLIAEDVAAVMPEAVVYNKIVTGKKITKDADGNENVELEYSPEPVPDAIDWNVIVIALIEENKKLKLRLDAMEKRIEKLEAK